jgi:hypothetical protein
MASKTTGLKTNAHIIKRREGNSVRDGCKYKAEARLMEDGSWGFHTLNQEYNHVDKQLYFSPVFNVFFSTSVLILHNRAPFSNTLNPARDRKPL